MWLVARTSLYAVVIEKTVVGYCLHLANIIAHI